MSYRNRQKFRLTGVSILLGSASILALGLSVAPACAADAQAAPVPASPPATSPAPAATTAPQTPAAGSVSEVVVTANKRVSQTALSVPGAIQAISGDSLQKAGTIGFLDVAVKIPGLQIQDLGPGDRKYVIRGVNSTGDSTTGVYYDEAVISGSNANDGGGMESDIRLFDMDHVEVLRGPQGTLYGASSESGTIRFVTKKPNLEDYSGYVSAEGSDTEHGSGNYSFNGAVNIPLIKDVLALRVVGWRVSDSGFIDQPRIATGELKGVNNDDVSGGRINLRFQPIHDLTIDAYYTTQTESSDGSPRYTPAGVTSYGAPGIPSVMGCDLCNTDVTRSPYGERLDLFGITINYQMPYGQVTATTNQYNRHLQFNFDSTPVLIANGVDIPGETEEPQQRDVNSSEIRYASKFDFPINFVAGVFRQYETNDLAVHVLKTDAAGDPVGAFSESNAEDALSNPDGTTFFGRIDDRQTTEYAAFTEVTWDITPKLQLVGGVRYFTETLEGSQEQTHPFGGFPAGQNLVVIPDQTQTFSKVTFKANASYKFTPNLMVYVTASEGFRGGGLNAQSQPFEPIPASYAPDSLWNFEAGLKGKLFDGMLQYSVDGYGILWNNIQQPETTADGAFTFTGNAGNAQITGFEYEFDARPIQYVTVSFTGSYQDAVLTKGATAAEVAANPTLGVTGDKIANVPPFQANLSLDYTRPINDRMTWTLAGDITYRDSMNSQTNLTDNGFNVPLSAYTLVGLRTSLNTGPWTGTVFVRNLGDDRAQISAINSAQDPLALLTIRPRTFGVSLTRTF
ncbi:MAG: TonB-dependent receptor [Caulobacteraceae bacterium]